MAPIDVYTGITFILFVSAFVGQLILLTCIGVLMSTGGDAQAISCDPYGNLMLTTPNPATGTYARPYNPWASEYLLAITFGWGRLDFATAKAIDVVWDLVVGRGWQVTAVWIVYFVFRRYWTLQMERWNDKMPVEAAMALQYDTVSPRALWTYARVMLNRATTTWGHRMSTLILVLCVVYILLVPTWVSAMTGYMALSTPMVSLDGNTFMHSTSVKPCGWMLLDGGRIGKANSTCLSSLAEIPGMQQCRLTCGRSCESVSQCF